MGIKLNILSILLHPSQFVYNYILNNFVFITFFDFLFVYGEIRNFTFFVGYPGALTITLPILFVLARFALLPWTKYCLTCHAAILI